jgi:hypothetical protein
MKKLEQLFKQYLEGKKIESEEAEKEIIKRIEKAFGKEDAEFLFALGVMKYKKNCI